MGNPEPAEESRFFEHGQISFVARDFPTREVALEIVMPQCLMMTVTPQLLGAGFIDDYRLYEPMATWMPQLGVDSFNVLAHGADVPHVRTNTALKARLEATLQYFLAIAQFLKSPSDIIPFLPMGIYVKFRYRVRIDDIPKVLEGVNSLAVIGVPEFQWAMASVLACVLQDFEQWESRKKALLKS